ncbi:transglycosylase SLT domain-containing protein [Teredinibacter haidensis]|uniref:transglycosylase SLT domain-containing protein n=1 Tax=Teredinibacter haidensis TaxID=2731755 RepID=UPI0009491122|nr:transglycosylase SLT domain-containing protein [Teredinibacter haidensis]
MSKTLCGRIILFPSWCVLFISIFTFSPSFGLADKTTITSSTDKPKPVSLEKQRYHYEMAKGALNKGEWQTFEEHYAVLGDYALVPYLDYSFLKYHLHQLQLDKIDLFLLTHKESFLETRLRTQLLGTLAVKKRWNDYLHYYEVTASTKELNCYWLYARVHENDATALADVAELWQQGLSHPKACDLAFNRWRRSGGLTPEIAWNRFHNAMKAGNRSLARYITGFMKDDDTRYAELYQRVHSYPSTIRQQRKFSEQSLRMQQIIAHGIKRYARKNPKDAHKFWELYEAQQLFPEDLSTDAKLYIATRLIREGETALAENIMNHSHELRENNVVEAMIRQALKTEDWERVLYWVNNLEPKKQEHDRWRYWRARAMVELDHFDKRYGSPEQIYISLASKRSFYGFLAADHIGRNYSLRHLPAELSPSSLQAVESLPGLRRAKELWLKGNLGEAQAEWIFTTKIMESDNLLAAGELARRWGWYNKGIHAMISGNLWDHLTIRFPLAYEEEVYQTSDTTKVSPELLYAIARQESAFKEKAHSSAGAMGLMQLMPATASSTARRNGIKHSKQDLYKPEHNIQLGGLYLNQLLEQYNGNRILAAAAYNAGPHRVNRWVSKNPQDVPYDIWIETIPFKETRGYVQNVLAFSVIYGYRLGQPRNMVSELEANSRL